MNRSVLVGFAVAAGCAFVAVAATQDSASAKSADKETGSVAGKVTAAPAKYARWAVVFVKEVKGDFKPPEKPVVMDQKDLLFVPHVLPVLQGTTVNFLNSDNCLHNVFSPDGEKYNLGSWPMGEVRPYVFKSTGIYTQLCKVHPEMLGYVVVLANPYFAVSDEKGAYAIDGIPAGDYTLAIWSESEKLKGQEVAVKIEAGKKVDVNFALTRK
jgi:plastocyanin